jgi:hypothetical protein
MANNELEQFAMQLQQEQQINKVILEMNTKCWDVCVTSPNSSSLDSRTKECLDNCVRRMIDSSTFIVGEFAKKSQQQQGMQGDFGSSVDSEMVKENYNFNDTGSEKPAASEKKGWSLW